MFCLISGYTEKPFEIDQEQANTRYTLSPRSFIFARLAASWEEVIVGGGSNSADGGGKRCNIATFPLW